ncbi:MAG: beta-hydroxyacyl-ACP dehydratase [Myxococcales bacterium]|nr:beta-hydroxyacyl-ACP dehydratase [Myxococcales bacterium]
MASVTSEGAPVGRILSPKEVLDRIPQQEPFRFIDEISEIDGEHCLASYRWREDADFYRGHFPGDPVTPGVLLVEALAQASVVAMGAYIFHRDFPEDEAAKIVPFFTDANVDFSGVVRPGERVFTEARKVFFRRRKLRIEGEMKLEDGTVVLSGTLSGLGIAR